MRFDWDLAKAATNLSEHRASFVEAKSVFFDEFAVQLIDPVHSVVEDRCSMLGRVRAQGS